MNLNIELIEQKLQEYQIKYSFKNLNEFDLLNPTFSEDKYDENVITYTYNKEITSNHNMIIFSNVDFDTDSLLIIVDNPKYIYYWFRAMVSSSNNNENFIGQGSTIGEEVQLGKNVRIGINTQINGKVKIGDNVSIGSNVVVGEIPFSFYKINDVIYRIEAEGTLILEDNVNISSNVVIQAPIEGVSRIGRNTVIDANVLLGHDFNVGANTVIAPNTALGGYTNIGDNCFIGLGTTTKNRAMICSNVKIGMGSVVVKDITESGTYFGNPCNKK